MTAHDGATANRGRLGQNAMAYPAGQAQERQSRAVAIPDRPDARSLPHASLVAVLVFAVRLSGALARRFAGLHIAQHVLA